MAQSLYPPDSEYDIAKLPASPVHVSHIMLAVAQTWQPYFWMGHLLIHIPHP